MWPKKRVKKKWAWVSKVRSLSKSSEDDSQSEVKRGSEEKEQATGCGRQTNDGANLRMAWWLRKKT